MSQKVYDFESYGVDYEGIDSGSSSDSLPPGLAKAMDKWLRSWDPRRPKATMTHAQEISAEHSCCNYAADNGYRAQLRARINATEAREFGANWPDLHCEWSNLNAELGTPPNG